ncbi:MAG: hypothetical protein U0U25_08610 [Flavobacteriales bacterium]
MASEVTYRSLAEVETDLQRLRAERALHAERIQRHWDLMRHPDSRRRLLFGSLRSLFPKDAGEWRDVLSEGGRMAGAALADRMRGSRHKLFWTGVAMALPWVAQQLDPARLSSIMEEAKVTVERIRERFSKRS